MHLLIIIMEDSQTLFCSSKFLWACTLKMVCQL